MFSSLSPTPPPTSELSSHLFPRAYQLNAQHVIYVDEQVILLINPGSWVLQYFSGSFFHQKPGFQFIFSMCVRVQGNKVKRQVSFTREQTLVVQSEQLPTARSKPVKEKEILFFVGFSGLWIKSVSFTDSATL